MASNVFGFVLDVFSLRTWRISGYKYKPSSTDCWSVYLSRMVDSNIGCKLGCCLSRNFLVAYPAEWFTAIYPENNLANTLTPTARRDLGEPAWPPFYHGCSRRCLSLYSAFKMGSKTFVHSGEGFKRRSSAEPWRPKTARIAAEVARWDDLLLVIMLFPLA